MNCVSGVQWWCDLNSAVWVFGIAGVVLAVSLVTLKVQHTRSRRRLLARRRGRGADLGDQKLPPFVLCPVCQNLTRTDTAICIWCTQGLTEVFRDTLPPGRDRFGRYRDTNPTREGDEPGGVRFSA
ncbi:hypothetical protein [Piscinibacterium candidicorallinum]|jgi:hypothetical protein|uniref:Uncharacterized protein n=1 Tax=Piscinibacterium candidicorallinum TaxID=1793872 RepID=A0ABV7H0M7_9BURK